MGERRKAEGHEKEKEREMRRGRGHHSGGDPQQKSRDGAKWRGEPTLTQGRI